MNSKLFLIEKDNVKYGLVTIETDGLLDLNIVEPIDLFISSENNNVVTIKPPTNKNNKTKLMFEAEDTYKIIYKVQNLDFKVESILDIHENKQNLHSYVIINCECDFEDIDVYYQLNYVNFYLGNYTFKDKIQLNLHKNNGVNHKIIQMIYDDILNINQKIKFDFNEKIDIDNIGESYIFQNDKYYDKIKLKLKNPLEIFFPFDDKYNINFEIEDINEKHIKNIIKLVIVSDEDKVIEFSKKINPKKLKITNNSLFTYNNTNNYIKWTKEIKEGRNEISFYYYYLKI